MTEAKPLGWGVVGASAIARDYMIPAINGHEGSSVVAVMSASVERGRRFAEENGIPRAYDTLEAILADPTVDIVYVSTTNQLHKPQTVAAARAGKHVFCEKPLALTLEDASEMAKTCRTAGVVFGTNHHFRNGTWIVRARDLLQRGEIGCPVGARISQAFHLEEELQGWRINRKEAGAGAIFDLAPHDADTLRFVLQDEVTEAATLSAQQVMGKGEVEDAAMGVLRFRGGAIASFYDAFNVPGISSCLEIHGTKGSLVISDATREELTATMYLKRDNTISLVAFGEPEDLYAVGVRRFNQAVSGEGTPAATGEDGLRSLAVALAIKESSLSGRIVRVRYP